MNLPPTSENPSEAAGLALRAVGDIFAGDAEANSQHGSAAEYLAAIVESSQDGIISKDLNSIVTSWNQGATRIFGYDAAEIVGQPITILMPLEQISEEPVIMDHIRRGERVEPYETVRRHKNGTLVDVSISVSPIRNRDGRIIGASKVARDITRRKRAEHLLQQQTTHLEQLNRVAKMIARDLDLDRTVQTVTDIATELTRAKFGAFFYNVVDPQGESYMLYTLSGAPRSAFERFGMPRNTAVFDPTFKGTEVVRSDDICADPRYGHNPPHHGMPKGHLPVVSYLAVPVIGRDDTVLGGLFFGHDEPGVFQQEAEDIAVGIAGHAAIAIDNARLHRKVQDELEQRRRAENAKELLLQEIQHRVKNTLGTVLAIATQTFRSANKEERGAFTARIQALASAHSLLTKHDWSYADIHSVFELALNPFREPGRDRFTVNGPAVELDAGKSLTLALVLHELGTNAVKYGSLSNDTGRVEVGWQVIDDPENRHLQLVWQEFGGPSVSPPEHKGFGSTLIERALGGDRGKARLDYAASGVVCVLEIGL